MGGGGGGDSIKLSRICEGGGGGRLGHQKNEIQNKTLGQEIG